MPGNDQFKDTTDVLVPLSVPMIEAQLKATFQDGIEQVLSSDHRDEDENANEQVSFWLTSDSYSCTSQYVRNIIF